jgi:hypothetical protein
MILPSLLLGYFRIILLHNQEDLLVQVQCYQTYDGDVLKLGDYFTLGCDTMKSSSCLSVLR